MRLQLGWLGTYAQTQHDAREDVAGQGMLDVVHDQSLLVTEARLSVDVGIARRFGASLMVPARMIGSSIRYLDASGGEVMLVAPNIHHRDETVSGLGDPMLLGSTTGTLGGWRFTARAGLTIPLGRTEEDPYAAGAQGLQHQHIQMGTGTLNPVVAAEAARSWGKWRLGVFALSQQVVYANGHGYQAGDRYAGGVALRRRLGERWSVRGGIDALGETAERWGGETPTDDGNRGRLDLIAGAGASWAVTKQVGIDVALKIPVVTHVVGGQLDMPAIVELGASWSFGGKAKPREAEEEHGHEHGEHEHGGHGEHEHGDGHGDGHGDVDHGPEHAEGVVAPQLDTAGLDVADVGKPGERVDLVPVPGKLTIFDFWATWCEPCKVLEPALVEMARAHPEIVAIRRIDAADWDSPVVAQHLTPKGAGLPHLKIFDPAGRLILERSSETGKLEALIEAVRSLVEAEAARRGGGQAPKTPAKTTPAAPSPPQQQPAPAPSPRPAAPPKAPAFSIVVTEKGFEPPDVKVPAGRPVTLRFLRKTARTCATEVVMQIGGKKLVKDLPLDQPVELQLTFPRGRTSYACAMDMIRGMVTAE